MENYLCSGEGFFYNSKNPSKGCYGISPAIEEKREEEWRLNSIARETRNKSRVVKALNLIRETQGRDIGYKISFLKKLGHSHVKIKGGYIPLNKITEKYYPNISRFCEREIRELREITRNPDKNSKLVERLDNLQ